MSPIAFAVLLLSLVAAVGLVIGSIRVRGISLGPAGVLFAGLVCGHFGATIDHQIAEFAKEFGLILFVFSIGLQLGPGIIALWRKRGLVLNAMALLIIVQGFALVVGVLFLMGTSAPTTAGLFCGATTNTPSLGAASQAIATASIEDRDTALEMLTSAYAVAYPGGIIGIIASMLLLRYCLRINVQEEIVSLKQESGENEHIERRCILVDNKHLGDIRFGEIPGIEETGVRISRIQRAGEDAIHAATEQTLLRENDVVQVVGTQGGLNRFTPLIGSLSDLDLMTGAGDADFRRISVTEPRALNQTLRELCLDKLFNATVTRIDRTGLEMTPRGSSRLYFGDVVHVVGDREALDRVTEFLGNSAKSLKETHFSPLFMGIAAGVAIGMIPFYLPGLPFPVCLGLAGGPLIAAIALSLIGNVGKVVWYVPYSANLALRELGIILFLACAGLSAGGTFFRSVASLQGLQWMVCGFAVTVIPLLTTGFLARLVLKHNYLTICGVIAGSMTDPPALAFANSQSESDASSAAYAAVYPLTMIMRIIAAQAIVLLFA